jgi:hypothetical protein
MVVWGVRMRLRMQVEKLTLRGEEGRSGSPVAMARFHRVRCGAANAMPVRFVRAIVQAVADAMAMAICAAVKATQWASEASVLCDAMWRGFAASVRSDAM